MVKYFWEAPARLGSQIAPRDEDEGVIAIPLGDPAESRGGPRIGLGVSGSGFEAGRAVPKIDLVYHGGFRRNDTLAALIVGLILSSVAAWWVAEVLFGLARDLVH